MRTSLGALVALAALVGMFNAGCAAGPMVTEARNSFLRTVRCTGQQTEVDELQDLPAPGSEMEAAAFKVTGCGQEVRFNCQHRISGGPYWSATQCTQASPVVPAAKR